MLMRGAFAVTVLASVAVITHMSLNRPAPASVDTGEYGAEPTVSMAPISLGNPTTAAKLRALGPGGGERKAVAIVPPHVEIVKVRKGGTLKKVLLKAGVSNLESHDSIVALSKVWNPKRLRAGKKVAITFQPAAEGGGAGRFLGFEIVLDAETRVTVKRDVEKFVAKEHKLKLERVLGRATGTINSSLYNSGLDAGLPLKVLLDLVRIYSWDVDFQREIQRGDSFDVMFERFVDKNGETIRTGKILHSVLTIRDKPHALYRFAMKNGKTDYFNEKGQSVRRALLKTPIDGGRLSSRYGRRKHPILGYTRMHKGVDFAAPRGTPIYAAGDGTISYRGRKGGYGKYIRIRHNSNYSTAYAHMKGYARGMRKGKWVKQGQVIGYVGSTGRSTGPHLHYEIMRGGRQVNPLRVKMPSGKKLKGKELVRFKDVKTYIDKQFASIVGKVKVAKKGR